MVGFLSFLCLGRLIIITYGFSLVFFAEWNIVWCSRRWGCEVNASSILIGVFGLCRLADIVLLFVIDFYLLSFALPAGHYFFFNSEKKVIKKTAAQGRCP